jgi:hypothetical protein
MSGGIKEKRNNKNTNHTTAKTNLNIIIVKISHRISYHKKIKKSRRFLENESVEYGYV